MSSCTALVLIVSILGVGAWATSRVDRVHVGFTAPPVDLTRPFNVLLVGSDRRPGEPSATDNADAVMVVRIDPTTSRVSVLSIPRDLAIEGADGPRVSELLRGDPDLLAETIQRELGIALSAYIGISFEGLVNIADAFGGLDVAIANDVADAFSGMDLHASSC
ncbi:MAG: LCP family protein, partial [Actinomycetes bacterium]